MSMDSVYVAAKTATNAGAAGVAWLSIFSDIMPTVAVTLSSIWIILQIYSWIEKRWFKK